MLTAPQVKSATRSLHDGDGLWLQVKNGGKSWLLRFDRDGQTREMGLGSTSKVTLAQARVLASEARHKLSQGIDPIEDRRTRRQARQDADRTFDRAAALYISHAVATGTWNDRKAEAIWTQSLRDYASPHIGKLSVGAITPGDVLRCLAPIWASKTATAAKVQHRIHRVLTHAKVLGWRTGANAAAWKDSLDGALTAPGKVCPTVHRAAMPWQNVPAFMAQLRASTDRDAAMLELLILCAVRTKPVWLMEWPNIDLDARLWNVPGPHEKSKLPHTVPLSDRAVAILETIPRDGDRVFPVGGHAMWNLLKRMGLTITPHGFRSSFRDWAGECGHNTDAAEAALSHRLGNATRVSYQRGTLLVQRQHLMQCWADYCADATIIPLRRAA